MRKLIVIIVILVIVFIGMAVYRNAFIKASNISIQEIEEIENYINQIYMWKEVTQEALPCFEDINQAKERWLWEVVKKNMEEDEPSYQQIQEKAKELFGSAFVKEFPKEGTEYLTYDEQNNQYKLVGVELDQEGDLFLLNKIEKIKEGYKVEIIEYLEDYSPMLKEEAEDFIMIRNLVGEEIGQIRGATKEEEIELVKRNVDRFSKKKITLNRQDGKLYIKKVCE